MGHDHIPFGHQMSLFRPPHPGRVSFVVYDHTGTIQAQTTDLGLAWTAAKRIACEHGRSCITGSDGTNAQITTTEIHTSDNAPWIRSIRQLQESRTHQ